MNGFEFQDTKIYTAYKYTNQLYNVQWMGNGNRTMDHRLSDYRIEYKEWNWKWCLSSVSLDYSSSKFYSLQPFNLLLLSYIRRKIICRLVEKYCIVKKETLFHWLTITTTFGYAERRRRNDSRLVSRKRCSHDHQICPGLSLEE